MIFLAGVEPEQVVHNYPQHKTQLPRVKRKNPQLGMPSHVR